MKSVIKNVIIIFMISGIYVVSSCSDKKTIEDDGDTTQTEEPVDEGKDPDPLPDIEKDPDAFYSAVSEKWRISSVDWAYYDTTDKEWKTDGPDPEYQGIIMGDAANGMLYAFGFWEDSFGFIATVDDSRNVVIPVSPITNPIARVMSSSGNFILFLTLYDFDTNYFYPIGNNIKINISEDMHTMTIDPLESEVTDGEETIKVKFNYLALIGISESGAGYSIFSNWSFPISPTFTAIVSNATRASGYFGDYQRFIKAWQYEVANMNLDTEGVNKVTDVIDIADIDAIESFWTF